MLAAPQAEQAKIGFWKFCLSHTQALFHSLHPLPQLGSVGKPNVGGIYAVSVWDAAFIFSKKSIMFVDLMVMDIHLECVGNTC